jgi:hypothetical protein
VGPDQRGSAWALGHRRDGVFFNGYDISLRSLHLVSTREVDLIYL